jgi:hypothetical protein
VPSSAATNHRAAPNNGRLSETSSSPPATLIPGKNFGRSRSGLWPAQVRVVGERAQLNDRHRHTETFDPSSDHHLSLTQHGPGRRPRRPHSSRNAPSPPHSSRNDLDVGEARSSAGRLSRARGRAWVVAWCPCPGPGATARVLLLLSRASLPPTTARSSRGQSSRSESSGPAAG